MGWRELPILRKIAKQKPKEIYLKFLMPKKPTETIKCPMDKQFKKYGETEYFINHNKITIDDGKYILYYTVGNIEPITPYPSSDEIIISSELQDALQCKIIKEFRTLEGYKEIEKLVKICKYILYGTVISIAINYYIYKQVDLIIENFEPFAKETLELLKSVVIG